MKLCTPHRRGVSPGHPPFFAPDCTRCQEKLAAGQVTGKEPPPARDGTGWRQRTRSDPKKFTAQAARDLAGRRKQSASAPWR